MSIYKKVTLRRGPCDGWTMEVAANTLWATFMYTPPQDDRITGKVLPPNTPYGPNTYELRYDFAYNDYNGPVFTYRDRHGLLAEERPQLQQLSCNERSAALVSRLRSYLDVAVLEAETRGGMLTIRWSWRINGQAYQYARNLEVAEFAHRYLDLSVSADLLHLAFLTGVGRIYQSSAQTNETTGA